MRNLMGRLHARDDADLARIAAFWRVDGARGRQSLIALLFRVLSDPRPARDAWDRLQPAEREMVRALALAPPPESEPTLPELAARLGVPEDEARETASRLYRVGILTREGDDEPLPVGQPPQLLLPRELASLFRRLQDELEAGDLSATPLRALIELLDDAEIEAAAKVWDINVVPGLRARGDLVRRLLKQLADPARVSQVVAARGRDAARLWQRVRAEPTAAALPYAIAIADAELAGDAPPIVGRRRAALEELESALLLWHTFRADGERWLFVPSDVRTPTAPPPPSLPPLQPVIAPIVDPPPWRHPDALAWDLLTLLREIADGAPVAAAGELPRPLARRLNDRFWLRGDDAPPPGYLDLLLALARAEGLVDDDPTDPGEHRPHHHPYLRLGPGARPWRDRSFAAQTERLRWWWSAAAEWIEGRGRAEVEVWGADWRGARRRLLALLSEPALGLAPATWYTLDSVATRIAAHDPDLLGPTFTAATARAAGGAGAGGDEDAARSAAIADVVRVELETAFAWFGLVALTDIPGQTRALRLPTSADPNRERPSEDATPPLVAAADGIVELRAPTPVRVWAVTAFADPEALAPISRYRLSAASLARALAAGFDLDQVTAFLERQSGSPLPPPLVATLESWAKGYRRVRVHGAVVVSPDDASRLPAIRRLFAEHGFVVNPLPDDTLLVESPQRGGDPTALVATRLREGGYAPQERAPLAGPTRPPTSRDGRRPESR